MKRCSTCKVERELDMFGKCKKNKDGLKYQCKVCIRKASTRYRSENKEKLLEYFKEYRARAKNIEKRRRYYVENREKLKEYSAEYYSKNKERYTELSRKYKKIKRQTDPKYRMGNNVSRAVRRALMDRNKSKTGSVWEALPYTSKQLCEHLEKQFDEHMSWDNYGTYWHVDHIYPQSLLPYENYEDPNFQKCWALENLKPLEAIENIKKSNKLL